MTDVTSPGPRRGSPAGVRFSLLGPLRGWRDPVFTAAFGEVFKAEGLRVISTLTRFVISAGRAGFLLGDHDL
jgi:hypothetical protein